MYPIAEIKIRESEIIHSFQIFDNKRKEIVSIIYFYNRVNQSFKTYAYLMIKIIALSILRIMVTWVDSKQTKKNFSGVICQINKYIDERVYE